VDYLEGVLEYGGFISPSGVVYNMWLLVDFLTQERIGVIETRKKPRITLSRFLDWLDKELITLI